MADETSREIVQTAAFSIDQLDSYEKRLKAGELDDGFDREQSTELQTDKTRVKLVSCRECGRALVVSTFYVKANARCRSCKGESGGDAAPATVAVPIPGSTDPAKAINLADCLVNPSFAMALCPVHPEDPEHIMELKSVAHSAYYGPREFMGYDKHGHPNYRGEDPGESVTHQCLKCKATVSYSTMRQVQLRRQNEVRQRDDDQLGSPDAIPVALLGARKEGEAA